MLSNKNWGASSSKVAIPQRLAGHRSAGGSWWMIAFASLALISSVIKLSSSQPKSVLIFALPFVSPVLPGLGGEQVDVWVLSCWLESAPQTDSANDH